MSACGGAGNQDIQLNHICLLLLHRDWRSRGVLLEKRETFNVSVTNLWISTIWTLWALTSRMLNREPLPFVFLFIYLFDFADMFSALFFQEEPVYPFDLLVTKLWQNWIKKERKIWLFLSESVMQNKFYKIKKDKIDFSTYICTHTFSYSWCMSRSTSLYVCNTTLCM